MYVLLPRLTIVYHFSPCCHLSAGTGTVFGFLFYDPIMSYCVCLGIWLFCFSLCTPVRDQFPHILGATYVFIRAMSHYILSYDFSVTTMLFSELSVFFCLILATLPCVFIEYM